MYDIISFMSRLKSRLKMISVYSLYQHNLFLVLCVSIVFLHHWGYSILQEKITMQSNRLVARRGKTKTVNATSKGVKMSVATNVQLDML